VVPDASEDLLTTVITVSFAELVPVFSKSKNGEFAPKKSKISRDVCQALTAVRFDPEVGLAKTSLKLVNLIPSLNPTASNPTSIVLDLASSTGTPTSSLAVTPTVTPTRRFPARERNPINRDIYQPSLKPLASKGNGHVGSDFMDVAPNGPEPMTRAADGDESDAMDIADPSKKRPIDEPKFSKKPPKRQKREDEGGQGMIPPPGVTPVGSTPAGLGPSLANGGSPISQGTQPTLALGPSQNLTPVSSINLDFLNDPTIINAILDKLGFPASVPHVNTSLMAPPPTSQVGTVLNAQSPSTIPSSGSRVGVEIPSTAPHLDQRSLQPVQGAVSWPPIHHPSNPRSYSSSPNPNFSSPRANHGSYHRTSHRMDPSSSSPAQGHQSSGNGMFNGSSFAVYNQSFYYHPEDENQFKQCPCGQYLAYGRGICPNPNCQLPYE
jgi:hypothetical protein